ncbi:MAG: TonB-dependent receptor [Crocinitomicaceae bacterium]|nr:MAG: TonB-dependent receptor [Crocinitomicaceae bacterium]
MYFSALAKTDKNAITMKYLVLFIFFSPLVVFGQIKGRVLQEDNKEPVIGAKIVASNGAKAITDIDGIFLLDITEYPVTLITSMATYKTDTTLVKASGEVNIELGLSVKNLSTVVVSASRRTQAIEDVPVSMEILKPALIDNKGITDLEQAVDQSPGVYAMDGQVSIRGGSGFAYGTGSRVLLLWNGMPLLSGYAGDTQWNAIPMEQASQIEIMKGASSVLYGSGALNGVISLSEKEPGLKPETKIKIQAGIYDNPARASLKWWSKNPMNQEVEAYRGQMFNKMGYTISLTGFHNDGYRQGESEFRGRVAGTIYFRSLKMSRLKAGIGYNFQQQKTGNFLIWESDSLGYTPSGGADTSLASSTLTYNKGTRLFLDPYVRFMDKKENKHSLKARMYYAYNENLTNVSQSNGATIYFTEYQIQRKFKTGTNVTGGISNIYNTVSSNLFGDHTSNNAAIYAQIDQKIKKLDITAGVRVEHFQMDGRGGDSDFMISKKDSTTIPVYPIMRIGMHYELFKYTHLRASFGQGIRYPSVAERYTQTNVGALNIFPNPGLKPEIGWAAEVGVKQIVKLGEWKGMLDLAGFINDYSNMMEFTFGLYKPDSVQLNQNNFTQYIGFQAQNAERARITGFEISFNSTGKLGPIEVVSLIGYTYMNPISLNNNPNYLANFSDTSSNLLKYRFKHLAKADVELTYKKFSLGFSCRYNSYMSNIDRVFEEDLDPTTAEVYILPGLRKYRAEHNTGNLVIDTRIGYKINDHFRVGLMVNNLLNAEYTTRPGDIQPPRAYLMQLQMKF